MKNFEHICGTCNIGVCLTKRDLRTTIVIYIYHYDYGMTEEILH